MRVSLRVTNLSIRIIDIRGRRDRGKVNFDPRERGRRRRKKKKKVQAYGETYDASIIEREFPWKKCSSFRTRALILPPGQIFCQTTGEKSGTVVVGKRKKEEKRISSNNHAMTNKVWKERLPFVRGSLSPPLFSFSRKTLLTILHD